jgi:2-dehydro-3-deoxyphosphogalactonate aldolase
MVMREWLNRCPLIAILRGIEPAEVADVFSELLAAGIVIAEIPLNSPEPFKSIERAAAEFSDRMLIGAGTVTRLEDVERLHAAGARLVVSPHADPAIVHETKKLGMFSAPGVGSATEAFAMVAAGADALKLFPADVLGARMLTGLRAVLPRGTMMLPVGGVDHTTIAAWRAAGADGYGVGSALYRSWISISQLGANARQIVACLHEK